MAAATPNGNVRYEPNDIPPPAVTIGAGAQSALVTLVPILLTVVIVVRIADGSDIYLSWAAFAALVVSGITTFMQAVRLGRIGSGHILIMGTSGAFIAVCLAALVLVFVANEGRCAASQRRNPRGDSGHPGEDGGEGVGGKGRGTD